MHQKDALKYPFGRFYLWDPWFIWKDEILHMFHLKAELSADTRDLRNDTAVVGHAKSTDLRQWESLPTAFSPSESGWDDLSIWTGSVIEANGKYYLFYTGRGQKQPIYQKIGLASSEDLCTWERVSDDPLLEPDNDFYIYEPVLDSFGNIPAWRDPFVYYVEGQAEYLMLICAQEKNVPRPFNACIAAARSKDLLSWELLPPILSPGLFGEMEIPQLISYKGNFFITFSCKAEFCSSELPNAFTGTYVYQCSELFGDYSPIDNNAFMKLESEHVYNMRLIEHYDKNMFALGWKHNDVDGSFIGCLSDVYKVEINNTSLCLELY